MAGVKGQLNRRGVERRREIVDAAIRLFARGGARGTSVAAVAVEAGVTPGAVLHHFGSKDALLLAVLKERTRRDASIDTVDYVLAGRGLDVLRRMMTWGEANARDLGFTAAYIAAEAEGMDPDSTAGRYFRERNGRVRAGVAAALRAGQADGEVRAEVDAEAVAAEVLAFLDGAALTWTIDPERLSIADLYRAYLNRLIRALAVAPDPPLIA